MSRCACGHDWREHRYTFRPEEPRPCEYLGCTCTDYYSRDTAGETVVRIE